MSILAPAALLSLYLLWGSTFVSIAFGLEGVSPLLLIGSRSIVGGLVLLACMRPFLRHRTNPSALTYTDGLASGVLLVGSNAIVAVAQREISASITSLIAGSIPIWIATLLWLSGKPPIHREKVGLLVGSAGLILVLGSPDGKPLPWASLLVLLAAVIWACGILYAKGSRAIGHPYFVPSQLIGGGVITLVGSIAMGESWNVSLSFPVLLSFVHLAVGGSAIAYICLAYLLKTTTPLFANSYAFICPVIGLILGNLLRGDSLNWTEMFGAGIVLIGVVIIIFDASSRHGTTFRFHANHPDAENRTNSSHAS